MLWNKKKGKKILIHKTNDYSDILCMSSSHNESQNMMNTNLRQKFFQINKFHVIVSLMNMLDSDSRSSEMYKISAKVPLLSSAKTVVFLFTIHLKILHRIY